ncbi:MAG: alanine/glycine:cation symporter family protein [Mycobacterium sp.]|uniref:alanine/glycine:cation symporter family protein n=1 Tax=Mycobacterium sp. TaxID=1785 RepID=UPI00260A32B5|nr:alanine/glycine:cation symporter family protein [Mycobacterium sp.]MDI3314480.1 alanine/glycine:cation symporter family protein [Mycobacterium sp.]
MDFLQEQLIDPLSTILYTHVLIFVLIGVGIYFTLRTRFVQIRYFGRMLHQIRSSHGHSGGISSFQAFCVGLASRVGIGNIAGVAIALTVGGPGAVFWMWVVAAVGMATALIEATLAQIFKVRSKDGAFRGGPAFYIQRGLGSRPGGIVFAILVVFTFGIAFTMVEANAISDVLKTSHAVTAEWTALGLVAFAAPVLFGGIRRVAKVAGFVLPIVATGYVLLALVIVAVNIAHLPAVIAQILGGAFGFKQLAGGFGGGITAAMLNGVKRGLFASEAGMGSAPHIAATATVSHPVEQGLIQSLAVFVDTMVVCTSTAFIVMVSGPDIYDPARPAAIAGASLTQTAIAAGLGSWTTGVMTIVVFVFAFSAVLSNYVCAEANLFFLGAGRRAVAVLKVVTLVAVAVGALAKLAVVWSLADVGMALVAVGNLIAICLLGEWAFAAVRDFHRQSAAGQKPVFKTAELPGVLDGDVWELPRLRPLRRYGRTSPPATAVT